MKSCVDPFAYGVDLLGPKGTAGRACATPFPSRREGPRHRVDQLEAAAGTEVGTHGRAVRERGPGGGDSARERDDRLVPQLREVRAKVGRDVSRLDGEHHVLLAVP